MTTAKVKWFNDAKGYGFAIIQDEEGKSQEVFVHFSAITNMKGRRNLQENQKVELDYIRGENGLRATKCVPV